MKPLRIADFGLRNEKPGSQARERQFAIRNPQSAISLFAVLAAMFLLSVAVLAQDDGPPPDGAKPPEKKGGTLKARPADDPDAASWVAKLAPSRPQMAACEPGRLMRHALAPDGSRLYYFRDLNEKPAVKPKPDRSGRSAPAPLPDNPRYTLFCVGPASGETKVMETGFDAVPPLFLPDGRLLVVSRRLDLNGDGRVDHSDERSLMICNADGGAEREITTLRPFETPLAVWRDGKEVLLSDYSRDDVNGWILTLPLSRGERTPLTRGFNVSLVDEGKLVVERLIAKELPPEEPFNPWRRAWGAPADEELEDAKPDIPIATVLDRTEHVLFNPADGSEQSLYNPSSHARLLVCGEGSYFGYQSSTRNLNPGRMPGGNWTGQRSLESLELLVVDDATHYDARAPQARNDYTPLAWVKGKGLLALEASNLKSKLVLVDRSEKLNLLAITEFSFDAQGFCASQDGLTVAWMSVEDSNQDGYLNPWQDSARPWFLQLAPRQ